MAKATAHWEVANYREAYGLFACWGILFNHESPLRPERFVTQKIVSAACRIAAGEKEILQLGNIEVARDWGWAPDYVDAMWRMLQQPEPEDYVIATGHAYKLEEFVAQVFSAAGLDWQEHVVIDQSLFRPSEIAVSQGNPMKAWRQLVWKAQYEMPEMAKMMVETKMEANEDGSKRSTTVLYIES